MYRKSILPLLFLLNSGYSEISSIDKEFNDDIFAKDDTSEKQQKLKVKAESFDKIANGILQNLNGDFSIEFTTSSLNKIDKYMCSAEKIRIQKVQTSRNLFKAVCVFDGVHVPLYGSFFNIVKIPVINRTTNELLTENDISYKYVRNDSITDRVIRIPQNIIGLKLSARYKPLSPVYDTDLSKPEIIKKNTRVVISIKTKNLKLETAGKLLENAQLNQVASVINLRSKRVIDCIIKSPTEVTPVGF